MTNEAEIPAREQYAYSVKIEQSAYGARVHVHVNSNNQIHAMNEAVGLYSATLAMLQDRGEKVAPIQEVKKIRNDD